MSVTAAMTCPRRLILASPILSDKSRGLKIPTSTFQRAQLFLNGADKYPGNHEGAGTLRSSGRSYKIKRD